MRFQFNLNFSFVLLLSITLFSCAKPDVKIWHENNKYTFTSVGYAPIAAQTGDTFNLQMLNAIKASKLEAYKELAEQIYGVLLTAENNVKGARIKGDVIDSQVKGLVRGARVLRSYHEGDVYITELELNMQTLPFLKDVTFNEENMSVIQVKKQVYY